MQDQTGACVCGVDEAGHAHASHMRSASANRAGRADPTKAGSKFFGQRHPCHIAEFIIGS